MAEPIQGTPTYWVDRALNAESLVQQYRTKLEEAQALLRRWEMIADSDPSWRPPMHLAASELRTALYS